MGGDLLEEKTSCGSKGSRERRLAGRKNLLWVKKSSWEETSWKKNLLWVKKSSWKEISWKKEPPAGQKAYVGGNLPEKETS